VAAEWAQIPTIIANRGPRSTESQSVAFET
jgi:hypothetical protein